MAKQYNLSFAGLVATPVVGDKYRLTNEGFPLVLMQYQANGSYIETTGTGAHEVPIDTLLATITDEQEGDFINPTGVTYTLNAPTNRRIMVKKGKWRCGAGN